MWHNALYSLRPSVNGYEYCMPNIREFIVSLFKQSLSMPEICESEIGDEIARSSSSSFFFYLLRGLRWVAGFWSLQTIKWVPHLICCTTLSLERFLLNCFWAKGYRWQWGIDRVVEATIVHGSVVRYDGRLVRAYHSHSCAVVIPLTSFYLDARYQVAK